MTRLALVMSHEEGYQIQGSVPNRNNNPLDLRHSPHSHHLGDPNAIGQIDDIDDGWKDADRQLELYAQRGMDIQQMINIFAPSNENNTFAYLDYVCKHVPCHTWDKVSEVIKIQA